ncbi:oligosaccharide repeat unit polymerase [Photobacterium angustum]|uniref:O-antigen polymerase n=1 Tax=Photobacterium angustum TaxID=661 RepID=UPI003D143A76
MIFLLLFVSIIILSFCFKLDKSKGKDCFIFSAPTVIIFLITIIDFDKYSKGIMSKASYDITDLTIYVYLFFIISYLLSFLVVYILTTKDTKMSINTLRVKYDEKKLDKAIKILFLFSLISLFFNLSNVGFNVTEMTTNARGYEVTFGKYWFINYIYFLHVVVLILVVFYSKLYRVKLSNVIIFILMIISSMFHGIKFTVFDAVFFTFFSFVVLSGGLTFKVKLYFTLVISLFIFFFAWFSFNIRGGAEDFDILAFVNYIAPNFINYFYEIESKNIYLGYPFDGVLGFITLHIPLLRELPVVDFQLNDKYNMLTGIPFIFAYFGPLGIVIFYTSTMYLVYYMKKKNTLVSLYVISYVYFCYFMMFYSYYFGTKYKYVYLLLVFVILEKYLRNKDAVVDNHTSLQCK